MLYFLTAAMAFFITALSLPLCRRYLGGKLGDKPTSLKTHTGIIPSVGGCAVAAGFFISLTIIRFATDLPTGTLNSLRGIFLGGFIIFVLGIIDDIGKPRGLGPYIKLLFQTLAAILLIKYGLYIQFLDSPFNYILTVLWVIGITNAFNLIDIMDGLAVSQSFLAAMAFLIITLPSEHIYVNFAAAALLGAAAGFWPFNHLAKLKSFLGDSGSTLLGFILGALALGASYSKITPMAVFVPLLILAVPIFDTCFVSVLRISKGISPLRGTADHYPLRLQQLGFKKQSILLLSIIVTVLFDLLAFYVTKATTFKACAVYMAALGALLIFAVYLKLKTK